MPTANERMLDLAIRHAVYLRRYGSGLVRDVVGFLNEDVLPELVARLEARLERIRLRGYDTGPWTTQRYSDLLEDTRAILGDGLVVAQKRLNGNLRDLAKAEAGWTVKSMEKAVPAGVEVRFDGLDLRQVGTILSQPIQGRPQAEWWDSLAVDTQKRLESTIGVGIATGQTTQQIVQQVRGTRANGYEDGVLQATRRQAEAIVRTATNHVSAQTREQTFAANADVVKGVQWVSTLDTRTTPICQARDGQVYPVNEGPRPPAHWGCRSTTVVVLKSWKDLGIDLAEAPEGTRASMNGQVADSLTYGQWLKQQPAEIQDEALGPARGRRFRSGVDVEDMVTVYGRPLTLEEIDAKT